jgi:putative endonuclease
MPEPITAVYILTNSTNRVLYTGVTSNLEKRIAEHRAGSFPGSFTAKYKTWKLVYVEIGEGIVSAIAREKQIKAGSREKKIRLIESMNPDWRDLSEGAPDQIASLRSQ